MTRPTLKVEIAFNAGYSTPAGSRIWTDVTSYVLTANGVNITHGRQDERSEVEPNICSLTFNNSDGRFTPARSASPYFPNVKIGRPIRVTSTPSGQPAVVRFLGYIDEWVTGWPASVASFAIVSITASSRIARLGLSGGLPSLPTLEPVHTPESLVDAFRTFRYSPLFVNFDNFRLQGSGERPSFSSLEGAEVTDDLSLVSFNGGQWLQRTVAGGVLVGDHIVSFALATTSGVAGYVWGRREVQDDSGTSLNVSYELRMNANGTLTLNWDDGSPDSATGTAIVNDGRLHSISVSRDISSSDLRVWIDGVLDLEIPLVGRSLDWATYEFLGGARDRLGSALSPPFVGYLGRLWLGDEPSVAAAAALHYEAIVNGFAGETPGERLERYAGYAGIALTETDFDTGATPIAHVDTTGANPLELMRRVADADGGVLFDAPDGTLVYQSRSHRYNAAAAITLDVATGEVDAAYEPHFDRSALTNEATATIPSGESFSYVDEDSLEAYGRHAWSGELITTSANEAEAAAQHRVTAYHEPDTRTPQLAVRLESKSAARQSDMLALGIGDRATVSSQPGQAADDTADYFVEGYTELIDESSHIITYNVTPAAPWLGLFVVGTSKLDGPDRIAY